MSRVVGTEKVEIVTTLKEQRGWKLAEIFEKITIHDSNDNDRKDIGCSHSDEGCKTKQRYQVYN